MSRVELHSLSCGYPGRFVLRDVGFTLAPSETMTIVGSNGSGKSTLLATISGALRPLSGEVRIDGVPLNCMEVGVRARQLAVLLQNQPLDPGITVQELVRLGRTPWLKGFGGLTQTDHSAVNAALEMCALSDLALRPVGSISGGERQRARIAMIVAQQTPVVLLDEPTNHLDVAHRFMLHQIVEKMRATRNVAVITVLHSLEDARRFSNRMLYLHDCKATMYERRDYDALRSRIVEASGVPSDWVY